MLSNMNHHKKQELLSSPCVPRKAAKHSLFETASVLKYRLGHTSGNAESSPGSKTG